MYAPKTASLDRVVPKRLGSRTPFFTPAALVSLIAVADTFGGLFQGVFPATLLLRTTMVGFLLVYIFVAPTLRQDFKILWLVLLSYMLIRVMVDYFVLLDLQVLSLEIGATLRLLYFPLLYTYLHCQIVSGGIDHSEIRRILSLYGWLILASLMLGQVTGLGGTIGGRGLDMEGGKGFMVGANEVGLMLMLTAPFVGGDVIRGTRSVWLGGLTQLIVYALAGVHVFTKSSLIAALTSAFSVYRTLVKSDRRTKFLVRLFLISTCAYLSLLFLRNLDLIEEFVLTTFFSALLNEGLVAFLFRGREDYISAIYPQLVNHDLSWLFLLFGAGEFFMRKLSVGPLLLNLGEGTTFEMDFFDLLGAYGVVGLVLFGAVATTMLRKAGPYRIPLDIKIAIFFVLVHAFMAGHVLFSPQVTTLLVLVLLHFRIDGVLTWRANSTQTKNFPS